MGEGGALAVFTNSSLAFEGQKGSTLPPMPSQATWKRGMTAEAGWTLRANHGGGYSYVSGRHGTPPLAFGCDPRYAVPLSVC